MLKIIHEHIWKFFNMLFFIRVAVASNKKNEILCFILNLLTISLELNFLCLSWNDLINYVSFERIKYFTFRRSSRCRRHQFEIFSHPNLLNLLKIKLILCFFKHIRELWEIWILFLCQNLWVLNLSSIRFDRKIIV